jgi:uncharacterized protein YhbP (UPF0306 family)
MAGSGGGRGVPRELSSREIDDFLRSQRIARLGCHADGVTYVVPLIYAYEDDAVVAVTTEGRKTAMLRENPRVCVEVDEYDSDGKGSWRSVIAHGTYQELDGDAIEPALALMRERFAHRGPPCRAARAGARSRRPPHQARGGLGPHGRAVIFLHKQGMRLCTEIEKHLVWEWTSVQRRSITRTGGDAALVSPVSRRPGAPKSGSPSRPKGTTH